MRLWRVSVRAEFRSPGAKDFGARWNRPGTDVVYAAASLALATLEFFIRFDKHSAPPSIVAHVVDVPDDVAIRRVEVDALPSAWDEPRAPRELQDIGTRWAAALESVLLAVPTAVLRVRKDLIPTELNYLINPAHPDFARLDIRAVGYALDPRLWSSRPPAS